LYGNPCNQCTQCTAKIEPTTIGAEAVFWRCHRRLVSDFLLANGVTVQHIMPSGELHAHTLTSGAKVENGEVIWV